MNEIDPIPSEPKVDTFKPVVCLLHLSDNTRVRVESDQRVLDKRNPLIQWQGKLFIYVGTNEDKIEGWVHLYRQVHVVQL